MSRTPDQIVNAEVHYCVSYLVSTLAAGWADCSIYDSKPGQNTAQRDLVDMIDQAFNLASPVDDWEEAALQAGYAVAQGGPYIVGPDGEFVSDSEGVLDPTMDDCWRMVCEERGIEPYQREVFEHWIVSDWLADQLEARGEKVDKDFAGMIVWARTTSGQGIASDSVIEAIAADLNKAG